MKKKKLLAVLLSLCMAISLLPGTALAAGSEGTLSSETTELTSASYQMETDVSLVNKLTIPAGVTASIDLNGHTLTAAKGITVNGSLTILDNSDETPAGKLTGTTDVITVNQNASLTIQGGTVEATKETGGTAIKLAYRSGITFTMTGGVVTGSGTTVNAMKGTVDIQNGTIVTTSQKAFEYAIDNNYGDATITIGKSEGTDSDIYITSVRGHANAKLTINRGTIGRIGGTINAEDVLNGRFEQDISNVLPAGKMCEAFTADGKTYYRVSTLTEEKAQAKIGNLLYASASVAASELEENETLTLLQDISGDKAGALLTATVPNATIDLNGYSVTNTNEEGIGIEIKVPYGKSKDCTATIKNGTGKQSTIRSRVALSFSSGNSANTMIININGNIAL